MFFFNNSFYKTSKGFRGSKEKCIYSYFIWRFKHWNCLNELIFKENVFQNVLNESTNE